MRKTGHVPRRWRDTGFRVVATFGEGRLYAGGVEQEQQFRCVQALVGEAVPSTAWHEYEVIGASGESPFPIEEFEFTGDQVECFFGAKMDVRCWATVGWHGGFDESECTIGRLSGRLQRVNIA